MGEGNLLSCSCLLIGYYRICLTMNVKSILVGGLLWPAQQQRLFVLLTNQVAASIMILALFIQLVVTGQLLMKSRNMYMCMHIEFCANYI